MRKSLLTALCGIALAAAAAHAEAGRATISDPVFGYSVAVPALGDPAAAPTITRLVVSGPMVDGFATNCNVQIQYPRMSHAEFIDLSLQQFAAVGFRLVEQKPRRVSGREATRLEYAGPMGGRDLHFLALVVTEAERVVMLTCTTPEARFAAERDLLQGVLDSLEVRAAG